MTAPGRVVTLWVCAAAIDARPVEDPLAHYVIVRGDLPKGLAAAQIVHAAGESSPGGLQEGCYAVVLAVEGVGGLEDLERLLVARSVSHRAIREPDLGGELTAIGLEPAPKSSAGRWVSHIPLYR